MQFICREVEGELLVRLFGGVTDARALHRLARTVIRRLQQRPRPLRLDLANLRHAGEAVARFAVYLDEWTRFELGFGCRVVPAPGLILSRN